MSVMLTKSVCSHLLVFSLHSRVKGWSQAVATVHEAGYLSASMIESQNGKCAYVRSVSVL